MGVRTTITRSGGAPPDRVWSLLAEPSTWPAWAPHMRHVTLPDGSAAPTIHEGQRLQVHALPGPLVLEVRITSVVPGVSWSMRAPVPVIGPVDSHHRLREDDHGCTLTVEVVCHGLGPAARAAVAAYRPVAAFAVRRLLGLAAAEADGVSTSRVRMCHADPP